MSWVYGIWDGTHLKVGSSDHPDSRIFGLQTGNPYPLRLLWKVYCGIMFTTVEGQIHRHLIRAGRHATGEWFRITELQAWRVKELARRYLRGWNERDHTKNG